MSLLGHRRLATGVFLSYDRRYLFDGASAHARDVVRHPGGVAVLPIDGNDVWLVDQYRTAVGARVLEVPAGRRDRTDGEPELGARRELAEEIGAEAEEWFHLTDMLPSPGYTDEAIAIYAARRLTWGVRRPDGLEEQDLRLVRCPLAEALDRIAAGEITDAKTQLAILLWDRRRSTL